MKNFRLLIVVACLCLAIGPMLTGCALFQTKATPQAKVYYSFVDVWTVAKASYDGFEERVVMPNSKITPANSAKADAAWNKFRASFQISMKLAQQNWQAPAPAALLATKDELLKLIVQLSN